MPTVCIHRPLLRTAGSRQDPISQELQPLGQGKAIRPRELRPDLITLDLALPDIDGTEVLRQIKTDSDLAGIPVIVVTARRFEPRPDEHVTAVLQKPFDATELEETVSRALGRTVEGTRES